MLEIIKDALIKLDTPGLASTIEKLETARGLMTTSACRPGISQTALAVEEIAKKDLSKSRDLSGEVHHLRTASAYFNAVATELQDLSHMMALIDSLKKEHMARNDRHETPNFTRALQLVYAPDWEYLMPKTQRLTYEMGIFLDYMITTYEKDVVNNPKRGLDGVEPAFLCPWALEMDEEYPEIRDMLGADTALRCALLFEKVMNDTIRLSAPDEVMRTQWFAAAVDVNGLDALLAIHSDTWKRNFAGIMAERKKRGIGGPDVFSVYAARALAWSVIANQEKSELFNDAISWDPNYRSISMKDYQLNNSAGVFNVDGAIELMNRFRLAVLLKFRSSYEQYARFV